MNVLNISPSTLDPLCRKYAVKRLSVFGSVLHGEARSDSDLDLLVEFEPGCAPGFAFSDLQDELAALLHARVDLHTPTCLSRYFRDVILREAQVIYVAS